MLKFLSFSENESNAAYFKHLIEAMFDCEIRQCSSLGDLSLQLKNTAQFDLIFLNLKKSNGEVIWEKMALDREEAPVFVMDSECTFKDEITSKYPASTVLDNFDNPRKLLDHICARLGVNQNESESLAGFVPVRFDFLEKIVLLKVNIYLKVSDQKYLLLCKKGDNVSGEDLKKYREKSVTHFFVKSGDFQDLVASIPVEEDLTRTKTNANSGIQYLDLFHSTIHSIGLDTHAASFAKVAMKSFMDNIHNDKSLDELVKIFIKHTNYISEHSFVVSLLANSILVNTNFSSEMSGMKLCFAAILHDITITSDDLAKKESTEYAKESDALRLHPLNATEFAKKFKSAPLDIDKILSQHHEKYDGSGYPRGLGHKQIAPLSVVFIIAHEIVDVLYTEGQNQESVRRYLSAKKEIYKDGIFKDVLAASFKSFNL